MSGILITKRNFNENEITQLCNNTLPKVIKNLNIQKKEFTEQTQEKLENLSKLLK